MKKCKKRVFCLGMGILLAAHVSISSSFVSNATDYAAEEEARKALPIASNSYEEWPDGPAVGAQGAILMEAETGTILYEKNIYEHLYPASVTKILTCLIGVENCQMDETITMSKEAVFSIPRDSSNVGLDVGEQITVEQCLYGILVGSANEAANALAEHVSGTMEDFASLMNERAKELGCENSNFVTTNGLHDENHYTCPYDLALIAQKFFDNELLCKMSSTPTYQIPQSPTQPDDDLIINTHNKLLFPGGKYNYDYIVGSKTGYTNDSRQTLVSCAEKDGMKLICVVMREESPHQFDDTISLFEYGFSNFQKLNIAANETEYTVDNNDFFQTENDVFGASNPILSISPTDSVVIPITAVFDDMDSELIYDTVSANSVASIQYTYHGIPVGSATVELAEEQIENTFDFENQNVLENEENASEPETEEDASKPKEKIVFVNVRTVIAWIIGIAGFFILLCVIKAIIDNYQFAKRRKERVRHKKRKRIRSEFDDFNF
ncbi:D-alanyl-D-alanine carboxypeptidase family protein [Lachnospiraceae bacterium JLR.KK008]